MPIGVGGAIAAGAGAVGAIGGALISSSAASSAADKQAAAANTASTNALNEFDTTRSDLASYRDLGENAQQRLRSVLSLPGAGDSPTIQNYGLSGLTFQPTQAQLAATPGYQFDLAQGLQSTANSNAAQGRGISGAALKGAAGFATGLANNTLTTQAGIFQNNLNNVINPLEYASSLGEGAAVQTGSQGLTATQNANALAVGGANASAAGAVGSANALAGGLSSAGSSPLNYLLYSKLLGGGGAGGGSGFYTAPAYGGVDPALAAINPSSGGIN